MAVTLHHAVRSDIGHVRDGNEDAGYAGSRLIAVADGMGGQAAGEVASSVIIGRLAQLDEEGVGPDALEALERAVLVANEDLRAMVQAEPELEGMGTTLTALLSAGPQLAMVHVGDSRCYLYRDQQLVQVTHDHTFVQTLVDDGQITPDEAAVHPQRSLLMRALDGNPELQLDLSVREARVGDRYLLCTDGLSGVISAETIAEAMSLTTPADVVERLVDLALRGGGPDNITVVVADIVDAAEGAAAPVIAGAAAAAMEPPRAPTTAAGRAAAAVRRPSEPGPARDAVVPRRVLRGAVLLPVGIVLALIAGLIAGWIYIQHQYYVGVSNGRVAIFQGVSGSAGPVRLSHIRQLAMPLTVLPPYFQQKVRAGIDAASLGDARAVVASLVLAEIQPGTPLSAPGSPGATPAPTPAPTTSSTP